MLATQIANDADNNWPLWDIFYAGIHGTALGKCTSPGCIELAGTVSAVPCGTADSQGPDEY